MWWKVGTGKTRVALQTAMNVLGPQPIDDPTPRVIVVVTRRKLFRTWRMEIATLQLDVVVLENHWFEIVDATWERMQRLPTILLISAAAVTEAATWLKNWVRFTILDEGYMFKNPDSARSVAVRQITRSGDALSVGGNLITARNIMDVWGQCLSIGRAGMVGGSKSGFRARYMVSSTLRGYLEVLPKPKAKEMIFRDLGDCYDVHFPPERDRKIHERIVKVESTPEQEEMWASLKDEYWVPGEYIEVNEALDLSIKLQTIANGWVKRTDDSIVEVPSNKLATLQEMLEAVWEEEERAVIWCAFREDVHMLDRYFKFKGIKACLMMGGKPFDHERWERPETRLAIATEDTGIGFNDFANVKYAFYFSQNCRWLSLEQSMGRHNRHSTRHPDIFYTFLQVDGSIDESVHQIARSSQRIDQQAIATAKILQWLHPDATYHFGSKG